jgi:uncharacterized membrane protein YebE (DUF533 family)
MFDAQALLNQFLGADTSATINKGKDYLTRNAGSLAGGAAAGSLGTYLLGSKKGRKVAKKAATYGGMALVAGLAYKAYSNYQNKTQGTTTSTPESHPATELPQDSAFKIENQDDSDNFGAILISAMIAAAKADGQIDSNEHQAIFSRIDEMQLSNDEKAFLFEQLNRPLDIDSLVAEATTNERAVEIYMASLMAIEVDTQAEQAYLAMLAARLNLEPNLVANIHKTLDQELE